MKIVNHAITVAAAGIGLTALLLSATAVQPLKIDFSDETIGAEPKSFVSVVGIWRIEADGTNKVLVVDGRQRRQGACALWRALRRIPRSCAGLCLFPLCGGQRCRGLPRWRNLSSLRG